MPANNYCSECGTANNSIRSFAHSEGCSMYRQDPCTDCGSVGYPHHDDCQYTLDIFGLPNRGTRANGCDACHWGEGKSNNHNTNCPNYSNFFSAPNGYTNSLPSYGLRPKQSVCSDCGKAADPLDSLEHFSWCKKLHTNPCKDCTGYDGHHDHNCIADVCSECKNLNLLHSDWCSKNYNYGYKPLRRCSSCNELNDNHLPTCVNCIKVPITRSTVAIPPWLNTTVKKNSTITPPPNKKPKNKAVKPIFHGATKNPPKGKLPEHKLPRIFSSCNTVADVMHVIKIEKSKAEEWKNKNNKGAVKDIIVSLAWDLDQLSKHSKFKKLNLPSIDVEDECKMPKHVNIGDVW